MIRLLFIALLALSISPVACSQQTAGTAAPSSNAATASSSTATTEDTDDRPVYTKDKCRFRIAEPEYQRYSGGMYMFDPNDKGRHNGWSFGFRCYYGASQEEIRSRLGIERVDGEWYSTAYHKPFKPEQNFEIHNISGKTWTGKVTEYDRISWGDNKPHPNMYFCLKQSNGRQVMCGKTQGMPPSSSPKATRKLEHILSAVKSIEFVDNPDATE